MSNKLFIDAIYDQASGEMLLKHPTDPEVYVNKAHYDEICEEIKNTEGEQMKAQQTCTYTKETVCSIWHKNKKTGEMECIKETEVKTCTCTPCG